MQTAVGYTSADEVARAGNCDTEDSLHSTQLSSWAGVEGAVGLAVGLVAGGLHFTLVAWQTPLTSTWVCTTTHNSL